MNRSLFCSARLMVAAAVMICMSTLTVATPDPRSGLLAGIYQVVSSDDPLFPLRHQQEWFLDFGKGMAAGKLSGSVAVSVRKNPNVRVRILAWQYFPQQGTLVIGNPYHEGSSQAVAAASWQMSRTSNGLDFQREGFRVILRPAVSP